jgi:2-keto-4-pentenoate hydratase/2-oxohepta-3-ene-1,7-dioic acid hydratase in catechol pathway
MKIFCVGRNYVAHIEELNNERPSEPVIFMKPETALIKNGEPFYIPDFSQDIHHEAEIVLRIGKEGKNIEEKFAHKYYDAIGIGIDFTARDLQQKLKGAGLPWELAKGFNGSAPVSDFIPAEEFPDKNNISFQLEVNGQVRQQGNTSLMLFNFDVIISFISKFFTLKKGDLIYTGTPKGVAKVVQGDVLVLTLEGKKMLEFEVK